MARLEEEGGIVHMNDSDREMIDIFTKQDKGQGLKEIISSTKDDFNSEIDDEEDKQELDTRKVVDKSKPSEAQN